ncbi:DinB family protein [Nonomuraea sp. NPDC050328]|uniref:DinB family protein n=1 Tax=Nonomuraea sp. NPDC050328 TaxID=3364361 RepID=UPI0037B7298B
MEKNLLDTSIEEPAMDAGEVEMALFALDRSRAQFAWKVGGLDAEALHRRHPPSAMTLAGLIKHLALVEDERTCVDLLGRPLGEPWTKADPQGGWAVDGDSPEELYALWQGAVDRSRAALAELLPHGGLDQRSKFRTRDGESPNLRRVLTDLHDEYARHVGHADLFREAIDGLVGEDPPQA